MKKLRNLFENREVIGEESGLIGLAALVFCVFGFFLTAPALALPEINSYAPNPATPGTWVTVMGMDFGSFTTDTNVRYGMGRRVVGIIPRTSIR
ncbi:MAG TPA: hypothetical protein VNN20_09100, partial [Thermodesulfobacteriota bacterium]|nr:hypothetical protein [Thermodesulfobacteriota bacterium]